MTLDEPIAQQETPTVTDTQPADLPRPVPVSKPIMGSKYDWFKSELAGLNNNLADLYHNGYMPEDHDIAPVEKYWSDPAIRAPYEKTYGTKGKEMFDQDYKNSKDKLDAYKSYNFDLRSTSGATYNNNTPFTRNLENAGYGKITKAPNESARQLPANLDPWGRFAESYVHDTGTVSVSGAKFGYREGAKNVLAPDGEFVPVDQYLNDNPGANMVYAVDDKGQLLTDENNLAYLRPLKYGEQKKTYEEIYTGKVANWFGGKGLTRPDWYAAQWLPKNVMNFSADVLDSGAELMKIFDNLWQTTDQTDWDKGLSEFQNDVASTMYVPTSEEGQQSWHSVENIGDQMAQIGGQLLGMLGVARGVSGLSKLAGLGAGTRAGSIAGRAWMASISTDDFVKQARETGLSPKEIAATFGMYFSGMYALAGISDIMVNPVMAKQSQKSAIDVITRSLKAAKQSAGGKLTTAGMYQAVKGGILSLDDTMRAVMTSPSKVAQVAGGMATESVEEQSEVWFDKIFKEGYNAIYGPYSKSGAYTNITSNDKDGRFKVSWDTLGTELAAAGTLGALGGGFFKAASMWGDNSKVKRETILSYGGTQNGYRDLRARANKMYENDQLLPGGKEIDIFGQPIKKGDEDKSRAALVHKAVLAEIDMAEKLWKAYGATEGMDKTTKIFDMVRNNYAKIFQDGNMERYTTLGADLAVKLNRVSELRNELMGEQELTGDQTAQKQTELNNIEKELKDIKEGKYASRFLHQSIFNANPSTGFQIREGLKDHERLDFEEFEKVNSYMAGRIKETEQINALTPKASLKAVLETAGQTISREQADKLIAELDEKYGTDENGNVVATPEQMPKYLQEKAQIEQMVYAKSMNPLDDLLTAINPDGSAGSSFGTNVIAGTSQPGLIDSLKAEADEAEKSGSSVFDDVTKLENLNGQLDKRIYQAAAMMEANPIANQLLKEAKYDQQHPTISLEQFDKITSELINYKGVLQELIQRARLNKDNFFKAANKAADQQRLFTSKVLANINNHIVKDGTYKELGDALAADVAAAVGTVDPQQLEVLQYSIMKKIHAYFAPNAAAAIEFFYQSYRANLGGSGFSENDYTLAKAIITFDPEKFRDAYSKFLTELTGDPRTPFPAQDRNILRVSAALLGGHNPLSTRVDELKEEVGARINRPVFTESVFLRDEQGAGKTLVSGAALRIAQIVKGGKAAVFAMNEEVRAKNYSEFKAMNVSMDESIRGGATGNYILNTYLNNPNNYKDVNYIVIDEATLYTAEELDKIDKKVAQINSQSTPADQKIRVLLMGDPMQSGAVHPDDPSKEYNIGNATQGTHLEKTEMTRFSFRTGNQDVLELLKQLRMWSTFTGAGHRIPDTVVKFNKKEKRGVVITDSFNTAFSDFIKSVGKNNTDFAVITDDPTKLSELIKTYPEVSKDRFMTVSQAQGRSWRYVFSFIPKGNIMGGSQAEKMYYKNLITAAGRAVDMVVMVKDPALKLQNAEGESVGKTDAFDKKQYQELRDKKVEALKAMGATEITPASTLVGRPEVNVKTETIVDIKEAELPAEEKDRWAKFITSLHPPAGGNFLIHSFYTNGHSISEDGVRTKLSGKDSQFLMREIFAGARLPFGADNVRFELRLQRNEFPTDVYNTRSDQQNVQKAGEKKLVLYAHLLKGESPLAEISVGGLTVPEFEMPVDEKTGNRVLSIQYPQAQSEKILGLLRADLRRAATETVSPFSNVRTKEEKDTDKQTTPLTDFKKNNPMFQYASAIWHVTAPFSAKNEANPEQSGTGRTPYLFYSSVLSQREIDTYLRTGQASIQQLENNLPGKKSVNKELTEVTRSQLKKLGVLSIPLNGGKAVPMFDFLEGLVDELKRKVPNSQAKFRLGGGKKGTAGVLKARLISMLDLQNQDFDSRTYDELKKNDNPDKKIKYLAAKVANWLRYSKDKHVAIEGGKRVKKKGVSVDKLNRTFLYNKFLADLYNDSLNSKEKSYAKAILADFGDPQHGIFKFGVYQRATTIEDSTEPARTIFGKSDLTDEMMSVPGYIAPEFPVFQLSANEITNISETKPAELKVVTTEKVITEPMPEAQIETIVLDKSETGGQSLNELSQGIMDATLPGANEESISKISGIWFKDFPYYNYFPEYTSHFHKKIYDTVFNLEGKNPGGITTNQNLGARIRNLKTTLRAHVGAINSQFGTQTADTFAKRSLIESDRLSRDAYYDYVMSHTFDTMLRHYFPSIKTDGKNDYAFSNTAFKFNPMSEGKDEVSHLELGSSIVRMHLFNTPKIETMKGKLVSERNLNKEDYVRVIRDMRDHNITTLPEAIKYFTTPSNTGVDAVKNSIYHRFLAPDLNSISLENGRVLNSLTAVTKSQRGKANPSEMEEAKVANNTVTALLSFLASGNEAEYVKVIFNTDGTTDVTGRILIPLDYYRMDLEAGIRAAYEVQHKREESTGVVYSPASGGSAVFKVPYGKSVREVMVNSAGIQTLTTHNGKIEAKPADDNVKTALFRMVGLGYISPKMMDRFGAASSPKVLIAIGKYLSGKNSHATIFEGADLQYWPEMAATIRDVKQIESAYGYNLMDGNKVNLMSLSFPYVRSNQKIEEVRQIPGPLQTLDLMTPRLSFDSYMLKEGFTTSDRKYFRPTTKMSTKESFRFDFEHLYLGYLTKNADNKPQSSVAFSPISFSDKGSAGIVLAKADFLMKKPDGKVNIEGLKNRTVTAISDYYRELGYSIFQTWNLALADVGINLNYTPAPGSVPDITAALQRINEVIPTLDAETQAKLVKSHLVSELHYTPQKGRKMGRIKESIISRMDPASLASELEQDLEKFLIQFKALNVEKINNLDKVGITQNEALHSFFWNWNWVSHNFRGLWIGPEEQYSSKNAYSDMVKRASQLSTNRQRLILRDMLSTDMLEGRKLGKTSKTAIITDVAFPVEPISYTGPTALKIFDGMAFHNGIAKEQMKASYGGALGFNVGANLKPISTYMNPLTGSTRYDKYASFEISQHQQLQGHDFVRAIDRLMKSSVPFSKPVTFSGKPVPNMYELENAMRAVNPDTTPSDVLDVMVQHGVQDDYIHEVIFDSSVKTGLSKLNVFKSLDEVVKSAEPLAYIERGNSERGLVLDASGESNNATSRLGSQFISAILQSPDALDESLNITKALEILGERGRAKIDPTNIQTVVDPLRDALNRRNEVGMIHQIASKRFPFFDNKMMMGMLYSSLASKISDESIRFEVFGGQQVLSAATGVWSLIEENGVTRLALPGEKGRDLKGFDALLNGVSIKTTQQWAALKDAVLAGNTEAAAQLRLALHQKLSSEGWEVQTPEVVISPTHFKAFGIPEGTALHEITPEAFAIWDADILQQNFRSSWIQDPVKRQAYLNYSTQNLTPEQRAAALDPFEKPVVAEMIAKNIAEIGDDGMNRYQRKFADFQKTLDMVVGRIPATTMHSITPVRVVAFGHGSDNTFWAHPDLLIFQGADQDIDKGNFLMYEPEKDKVTVPQDAVGLSTRSDAQIRNFIVHNIRKALTKPQTSLVSTMPTSTAGMERALEILKIAEQNALQTLFNPMTNTELFIRGQGGKANVSIHAVGLKVYAAMLYSSFKSGNVYGNYTPISGELGLGGKPAALSRDLSALQAFDEIIQASLDNAKNPLPGRAGINQYTANLANALAAHGYSIEAMVAFLNNPAVVAVFREFEQTKEFGTKERPLFENLIKAAQSRGADAALDDLAYFYKFSEQMGDVGRVLAINKEVPNTFFKVFNLKQGFDKSVHAKELGENVTVEDFVNSTPVRRKALADKFKEMFSRDINLMEILNDNEHMLSYLKSYTHLDSIMKTNSRLYPQVMELARQIPSLNREEQFNSLMDFTRGLGIDSYLRSKGEASVVTLNGVPYDLRMVGNNATTQGRLQFMRDLPNYLMTLNFKPGHDQNIQSFLIENVFEDNLILKPNGNFRDFSPTQKVIAMNAMKNVDMDLTAPVGDSSAAHMLSLYSLIKDKGGVSGTAFTEMFDYNSSIFNDFDGWMATQFTSEYFAPENQKDFVKQFILFDDNYYPESKDLFGAAEASLVSNLKEQMRISKYFIPYSNGITANDNLDVESMTSTQDVTPKVSDNWIEDENGRLIFKKSEKKKTKEQRTFQEKMLRQSQRWNISPKMMNSFVSKLGKAFGVQTQVTNSYDISTNPALGEDAVRLSRTKGFVHEGVIYVNTDLATIDTPMHELSHIWLGLLKTQNPALHQQILSESLAHPYAKTIREMYPEEDENGIAEETFAFLLGLNNSKRAYSQLNTGFLARTKVMFDDFMSWLRKIFSTIFDTSISVKDSLADIIDKVGESMVSALEMNSTDAVALKILGVNFASADPALSAIRERLRSQKRFEKIC